MCQLLTETAPTEKKIQTDPLPYFGKIISGLIIYIGFMMAGWTERKQALHDMLADTLVVRKPSA